jgi:hypothetical protein
MFEQDLNAFLLQEIANGTFVDANLVGVSEDKFVGEAHCKIFNTVTNTIDEKKIFLYKVAEVINFKIIGDGGVNKSKIPVIVPRREAGALEVLPFTEILTGDTTTYTQVRYDFFETNENGTRYFNFKYIDVVENVRDTIIVSLIRLRYTQDQENALLRQKLMGISSIEFLKFNNYVNYSKAVADGLDLTAIKAATAFEIIIPLDLCNMGADYGSMAFETIIKNITFEADALNNVGKAYPSWLDPTAQAVLQSDPRVSLSQVNLYEEV